MFHKTGGNMEGAASAPNKDKPTVPDGTTHVWTPAVELVVINGWVYRRAYYKETELNWYSWSPVVEQWLPTQNPEQWFNKETKDGYFVTIEQFKHPDFKIKPEKING